MKGNIIGYPLLGEQVFQVPRSLRVIDAWDYLNEVAFKGEMTRPKIVVWAKLIIQENKKKYELCGAYDPNHKDGPKIWIRYKDPTQLETLYHEMCHQYIAEILGEHHIKHGRLFNDVYCKGLELISNKRNRNA